MTDTCKTCKHFNIGKPSEDEGYHECVESFGIRAGIRSHNSMDIEIIYRESHRDNWCWKHEPADIDTTAKGGA